MRDIREDLQARFKAVQEELTELRKRLGDLEDERKSLVSLLLAENRRWSVESTPSPTDSEVVPTVREVIDEMLNTGEPWSTIAMAQVAVKRGCDFEGSAPGRAVHGILLGMLKSGQVEQLGEGKWRLRQIALAS